MSESDVVDISAQMIWVIIKCAAPLLLVSLIVGLIISVFQTVTSIQEQTLTFVPKLLAIFITLLLTGNWIMNNCVEFLRLLCENFSVFVR
ncbi:MAG: flagellar biosynthesis protein FliQ [Roseburia sp.]|nr:flagellar biosynthesis protein FliQ [Roseburia sp.]